MGFVEGQLAFNNPNLTYNAGQTVFGKLVFDQNIVESIRALYVTVEGYCNIHWTTDHSRQVMNHRQFYTKTHDSYESYFKNRIYLMGGTDGELQLQPGHHEFPFQYQIPNHCPSSYESKNGHVRYEVKAIMDRTTFIQEKVATLIVIAGRDLNVDPYCKRPMAFEFKESYCKWCLKAGVFELMVRVPQSGYCPGQFINMEVDCANRSSIEIFALRFKIKMNTTFRAEEEADTRYEKEELGRIKKGPIPPNTMRNWLVEMEVPDKMYNMDACTYIDVDYDLEVAIASEGYHQNNSAAGRLMLGTIPLREFDPNAPLAVDEPSAINPPATQAYPLPNQPYPDGNSPYPGGNSPDPGRISPYPPGNSPYPCGNSPYPNVPPMAGFPIPGAAAPYPSMRSPYAAPSAPEPETPDFARGERPSPEYV